MDSIYQERTLTIQGEKYYFINTRHDGGASTFIIKDHKGAVVFKYYEDAGVGNYKFIDFDGDGYKDIMLELLVADSEQEDLILYDPRKKRFVFAGNCPQGRRLKHTKYFYTYEDGSTGRVWDSKLFYIADAKMVVIGKVAYNDGDGLAFYKYKGNKQVLLKKRMVRINGDTPVTTGPHIDFDIDKYWPTHWQRYIK